MANKSLFQSFVGRLLPKADTRNEAGGVAYLMDDRHALAQFAATGCLNGTFYASAEEQLDAVLGLCARCEPAFVAQVALFARREGRMKDMPAVLCAALSVISPAHLAEIFHEVMDSPKMVRSFVQIIRSGVVGRKSLGSLPKRLVREFLARRSEDQLFTGSVGADPSLADMVKMVHPKPSGKEREAFYGWLLGRAHDASLLPARLRAFEAWKAADSVARETMEVPDVPFQMLAGMEMDGRAWKSVAKHASWQTTRMNLNTFARHGVFKDAEATAQVAKRLANPAQIARAGAFPYQLMVAYTQAGAEVPTVVREALQDAMEVSVARVPKIDGSVFVLPDVSGSMDSPVTGQRAGATTSVRCIDVAALVAASVLRVNPGAVVIPFADQAYGNVRLNPRDSVFTNAKALTSLPCGGTACSAPLALMNARQDHADLVVFVSDNQSWMDTARQARGAFPTETMRQWNILKERCPKAKMVCIDLQPYGSVQAPERDDVLHVGGFSDRVFDLLADAAAGRADAGWWVKKIEAQVVRREVA